MSKILFVEDDSILSRVYTKAMQGAGLEVTHAADGEAGLTILQVMRPDLILLDLMLPRISGVDLLRIIRGSEDFKDTPVIVFSSAFRSEMEEDLEKLGATRVLSKSEFVPKQVIAFIKDLLPGVRRHGEGGGADPALVAQESARIPQLLRAAGQCLQEFNREPAFERRGTRLRVLKDHVSDLQRAAIVLGQGHAAYLCEALDLLLRETADRSGQLSVSMLRTITQAVDFLPEVFEARPASGEGAGLPSFRFLIVDDDSISRCGIQLALGKIKQSGVECASATEALTRCATEKFDLIFLDVELPEMNGFELCATLRREGANREVPIIFVTRHAGLEHRAQASLSGASDFLTKPFHFVELAVKALLHLLRRKRN